VRPTIHTYTHHNPLDVHPIYGLETPHSQQRQRPIHAKRPQRTQLRRTTDHGRARDNDLAARASAREKKKARWKGEKEKQTKKKKKKKKKKPTPPPPERTQKREKKTNKDNAFPEKKKPHKYNPYFQA